MIILKNTKNSIINFLSSIADRKEDTLKQKQDHRFLIYIGLAMSLGGVVWGSISFFYGLRRESIVPYSYTAITILNFIYLYYSKNFVVSQTIQILASLFIPFLFQLILGGFIASGAVIIWSILAILVSFTFQKKDMVLKWFYLYIILIIFSGFADREAREFAVHFNTEISVLFFTLNIATVSVIIFTMFIYFINTKEELQEELSILANTDLLTDIPNRRHFFTNAKNELSRSKRHDRILSIFMLDIDFFKTFNDNYGHAVGDEVLIRFANLLKDNIRDIDILCRYGGEEFIILMPETTIEVAILAGQRIIDNCHLLIIHKNNDNIDINITVSIGVTQSNHDDKNIDEIIKRADDALYKAKANGRDQLQVG